MFMFAIGAGMIKELSRIERLSDYFIEYSHKLLNKIHIVKTTSLSYPPPLHRQVLGLNFFLIGKMISNSGENHFL